MNANTENSHAAEEKTVADDEEVLAVSKRLMAKNRKAYEVLAG